MGDYDLTTSEDGSELVPIELTANIWRQKVKAGVVIDMSAILRRVQGVVRECPGCKRPVNDTSIEQVAGMEWCVALLL